VPGGKSPEISANPPLLPWHGGCSADIPSSDHGEENPPMLSRERVESVLDRIRPMMQADGGDIELVEVHGNSARVRLTGMCSGCPSAHMTLYMGVEMALRDEIKEFEELQVV
jgi:Fe-S cluster biogenesis protein NfuA